MRESLEEAEEYYLKALAIYDHEDNRSQYKSFSILENLENLYVKAIIQNSQVYDMIIKYYQAGYFISNRANLSDSLYFTTLISMLKNLK